MIFNSYIFWLFFVLVFVAYRCLNHKEQNYFLLGASYFFYGFWDWRFLFLMLFSTVVDFFAARFIGRSEDKKFRKRILVASIIIQLTFLGIFKYYNFFSTQLSEVLAIFGLPIAIPILDILLPVGISFYTFQTMSYTIDVYRNEFKYEMNFVNFALFVSFFPHLVAGPLVRARKLLPQITSPRSFKFTDVEIGFSHILLGLFKKVCVGDNLAAVANGVFNTPNDQLSGFECLLGVYAFAFQIYADFSGYSSIAIGVAKWLGIDLTINFKRPYLAVSPADFWARWHISLSTWFRDYVFTPLARRKKGNMRLNLYAATFVVMLLSGLWHGAAWTFIAWGAYHGMLLFGHRFYLNNRSRLIKRTAPVAPGKFGGSSILSIVLMFNLVCFGWIFFRAESLSQVWRIVCRILSDFRMTPVGTALLLQILFFVVPLMVYEIWLERDGDLPNRANSGWIRQSLIFTYFSLMLWFFPPLQSNVFIYFQF